MEITQYEQTKRVLDNLMSFQLADLLKNTDEIIKDCETKIFGENYSENKSVYIANVLDKSVDLL